MKKTGIVSCDKWKGIIEEDIFLRDSLKEVGYNSEIISWQDKNVDYQDYECLILRSVWGYQNDYSKFKEWLLFLRENNIKLFNDIDIILNNIKKDLQFDILDRNSIIHIPTKFIKTHKEINEISSIEVGSVIKPIISGSGNNTFRLTGDKTELNKKIINIADVSTVYEEILKNSDNGLMIQPYIEEVKKGEYACIYINGINTHNMLRFPGIFTDKRKPVFIDNLPVDVQALANKVSLIDEYSNYLYLRVDVAYNQGVPVIMEVELAEPDLLTRYIKNPEIKTLVGIQFVKGLERKR